MKVYKFRSLGDCQSLDRAEDIVRSGRFWCSRFWELNDPMEGIYRRTDNLAEHAVQELFTSKASMKICSFSKEDALMKPIMWGYYANGFKGIAIEIEVDSQVLRDVKYIDNLQVIETDLDPDVVETARNVLSQKLKCWEHESEMRLLTNAEGVSHEAGRITAIIIGASYPKTLQNANVNSCWEHLDQYNRRVERLIESAKKEDIVFRRAMMRNGKVQVEDW